jgi:hypothetical protein
MFPRPRDDGARWLAFEYFSGRAAPEETQAAVTAARQRLAGDLLDSLSSFAVAIGEPRVFARVAAEWSLRAAGQAPLPTTCRASNATRGASREWTISVGRSPDN